jgi:hypothetical protein
MPVPVLISTRLKNMNLLDTDNGLPEAEIEFQASTIIVDFFLN